MGLHAAMASAQWSAEFSSFFGDRRLGGIQCVRRVSFHQFGTRVGSGSIAWGLAWGRDARRDLVDQVDFGHRARLDSGARCSQLRFAFFLVFLFAGRKLVFEPAFFGSTDAVWHPICRISFRIQLGVAALAVPQVEGAVNRLELTKLGKVVDWPEDANLLTVLVSHGAPVARSCGGEGICGTCRVQLCGPELPEPSPEEQRVAGRVGVELGRERVSCLLSGPKSASKTWELSCSYW